MGSGSCRSGADSPGFVVNRVLIPYLYEAVLLVAGGLKSRKSTHHVPFRDADGTGWLLDQIGLDVAVQVALSMRSVLEGRPRAGAFGRMHEHGWLGQKTGKGFYD